MIEVELRRHADDVDVWLEILGQTTPGNRTKARTIVWGMVHIDMIYDDEDVRGRIQNDEIVKVRLQVIREGDDSDGQD